MAIQIIFSNVKAVFHMLWRIHLVAVNCAMVVELPKAGGNIAYH